ncbi:MAG: globin [Cellvibrionales bacterium]|nr:MAG: globin [Cellvibrionales bacterium]
MTKPYGVEDASFQAAGGQVGIGKLVDRFYEVMDELPDAQTIRAMHPDNLAVARDKLTLFLCGWLGGEKLFSKKYGSIMIPRAHAHLEIAEAERDAWLACMKIAVDEQDYELDFRIYLMEQLFVPAERCRQASQLQ